MERVDGIAVVGFLFLAIFVSSDAVQALWQIKKFRGYEGYTIAKVSGIREVIYYERIFTRVTVYYITYQYIVDGTIYESETPGGTCKKKYTLWSEEKIRYDKDHPEKCMAEGDEEEWKNLAIRSAIIAGMYWLFIIFGLIYEVFFR
jgi:hypothetical protein